MSDGLAEWLDEQLDEDEARRLHPSESAIRMLRETEAKRQLLDEHKPGTPSYMPHRPRGCLTCTTAQEWDDTANEANCRSLRLLALPYADRLGYREEWRP